MEYLANLIVCAVFAAIPSFMVAAWLKQEYTKYPRDIKHRKKREEALELARREGRTATATLKKSGVARTYNDRPGLTYWCRYEYLYNGKKYKYKCLTNFMPDNSITLYFRKNPKKATTEHDFGKMEGEEKYVFLVSELIFTIIIYILYSQFIGR